ncbi:hypothetical protein CBR_g21962 [Chara braunii]|uniref:non-specific serine/threonine protein kinase n=1 Tax=Chara braunii TaxID=69332 RepID=A0A388L1Z0_CHABU|nr:hypothetical protein CBR_g21962 [Chara braunii]|eukprot:GBG76213.1 hypothetical protein CBR_g21962 [Chara braunii]
MENIVIIVAIVAAAFLFWTLVLALLVRCSKNKDSEFCSSITVKACHADGAKELLSDGGNTTTPCVLSPPCFHVRSLGGEVKTSDNSYFSDSDGCTNGPLRSYPNDQQMIMQGRVLNMDLEAGFIGQDGSVPNFHQQPCKMRMAPWLRRSPATIANGSSFSSPVSSGPQEGMKHFNLGLVVFTLHDLKQVTERFSLRIGAGGFGPVYKGVLGDGQMVAVKLRARSSRQGLPEFHKEVEVLSMLRHRHLVRLIGYCCEKDREALVYEYICNGTLKDHLFANQNKQPLPWRTRLKIVLGVARGVDYLHNHVKPCIVHRDIKPANILLDEMYEAKVADFGLSRPLERDDGTHGVSMIGTSNYRGLLDPQIAEGSYSLDAVKMIAKLATHCCQPSSLKRPLMMQVLRIVQEAYDRELAYGSYVERLPSAKEEEEEEEDEEEDEEGGGKEEGKTMTVKEEKQEETVKRNAERKKEEEGKEEGHSQGRKSAATPHRDSSRGQSTETDNGSSSRSGTGTGTGETGSEGGPRGSYSAARAGGLEVGMERGMPGSELEVTHVTSSSVSLPPGLIPSWLRMVKSGPV